MLAVIQTYSKELAAIAAVLLTFSLNRFFRSRPRLRYGTRHAFNHLVEHTTPGPDGAPVNRTSVIRTASINILNSGLTSAKGVEITFNWKPQFLNVWPARHFTTKESAFNRFTLALDSIAPREVFGIEIVAIDNDLPAITNVRCDEGEGEQVEMQPQQVSERWKVVCVLILMVVGLATLGYGAAWTVQQLAR